MKTNLVRCRNRLPLHLSSPPVFYGIPVAYLFLDICVVLYFVFLRLLYSMFPVSLDCPFLIAPSVFSSVYLVKTMTLYLQTKMKTNTTSIIVVVSMLLACLVQARYTDEDLDR